MGKAVQYVAHRFCIYAHLMDFQVKIWLSITPLVGAALVAISRTMDYRREC